MHHDSTERVKRVRRFFELLGRHEIDEWASMWAKNGRIIVFYPPEGFGSSIEGRDTIVGAFRELFANFQSFHSTLTGLYPAADSDAVVAEYVNRATLRNGVEYTNDNIAVFRFDGELIHTYHDYFDPRRFQRVVDALRG